MKKDCRIDQLKANIPELFTRPGRLLYIGASRTRSQCVPELFAAGNEITLIEAFPPNAAYHRKNPMFKNVLCLDIMSVLKTGLPSKQFDYIFWWHGPEHVRRKDFISIDR